MTPYPKDQHSPQSMPVGLLEMLPEHLLERTRAISLPRNGSSRVAASHETPILYWTHHAQRTDENPALDVACALAHELDRPLLVYQGLSSDYRYSSDRHHVFQLQAAKDLQLDYRNLGIRYAFHLQTRADNTPWLTKLAQQTDLLITDDFPGEPTDRWLKRLSLLKHLTILAVDTACVVPMQLVGRAFDRAFAFRDATKKLYRERLDRAWPKTSEIPRFFDKTVPFDALDCEHENPYQSVSRCPIDPMVPPVADTIGGTRAGYQRWDEFLNSRIARYASKRNDPCGDVSSRMSAYLHYGMVSPMRLARQANQKKAEKYLDELLIWRELAYGYCFYKGDYRSTSTLPNWALDSLHQHMHDPREAIYSWETLARGQTRDALWNACQLSLLRHGELHNNVRMTWGKSILQWTKSPEQALEWIIDLNHRYALDGRDPASYGGILWCLGQFDRPFYPEQPVLGTVRPRPTSEHLGRLDLTKYQAKVSRSIASRPCRVAVVGAGVSGLICARTLHDMGLDVEVFEKSRGLGGRAATRRTESGLSLDHGAPFLETKSRLWDRFAHSWEQDQVVCPWQPRFGIWTQSGSSSAVTQRDLANSKLWVGLSGMNRLGKHLAEGLTVRYQATVDALEHRESTWTLRGIQVGEDGASSSFESGPYDCLVLAIPAPQAASMVPGHCSWKSGATQQTMEPVWAALIEFQQPWQIPWDAISFENHPCLDWISRESSKPNRAAQDAWVVHATHSWTHEHLECKPEQVARLLLESLVDLHSESLPKVACVQAHRWRYAQPKRTDLGNLSGAIYLWDIDASLGACGDWITPAEPQGVLGRPSGLSRALESGAAMAGEILRSWIDRNPIQKQAIQQMLF